MLGVLMFLLVQTEADTVYNLRDFRLPDAGAMKLYTNLNLLIRDNVDYFSNIYKEWEDRDSYRGGTGKVTFLYDRRGEKRELQLDVSFSGHFRSTPGYYEAHSLDSLFDTTWVSEDNNIAGYGEVELLEDWRYYVWRTPVFIGIASDIEGEYSTSNSFSTYDIDEASTHIEYEIYGHGLEESIEFSPQLGIGRLRPLEYPSRALVANEIVREMGFDSDAELVNELAQLFADRWRYPIKYWKSDWEFYEDMEEILLEHGIKPEEMRIRSWMRIIDASSIWEYGRPYGIRLTLRPTFRHFYYSYEHHYNAVFDSPDTLYIHLTEENEWHESYGFFFPVADVSLEGGYPINNWMHLQGEVEFRSDSMYGFSRRIKNEYTQYSNGMAVWNYEDTTTIWNFNISDYSFRYSMLATFYVIYTMSIKLNLYGYYGIFNNPEIELNRRRWDNGITLGAEYTYRDKLTFACRGGFEVSNYVSTTAGILGYKDFELVPEASITVGYRIF